MRSWVETTGFPPGNTTNLTCRKIVIRLFLGQQERCSK